MTIFLKNLIFHSFHGLYPEEGIVGGRFVVDLEISYDAGSHVIRSINETIDYEKVYRLVAQKMGQPEALLETLVMEIAYLILDNFPRSETVKVTIEKSEPPIEGMEGNVAVQFVARRN